jgi:hypothetical protein
MTGITKSPPTKPTTPRRRRRGLDATVVTSAKEIPRQKGKLTGELLVAAMQASPYRDIDIEPERGPMPTHKILL